MIPSMFDLKDRVAVVSGAAQGLGQATALALAQAGCNLVLVDRNLAGAQRTAAQAIDYGVRSICRETNVSDPVAIAELFDHVDRDFGRVDFLGNIAGDGILAKPEELQVEQLQQVLSNLVIGRFCMCQQAGKRMLAQGRGSIMNIGS
jgi:NAD(P)-dependent dehydrogenase (short-subunit alcohol dehydrogenase family)